MRNDQIDHQCHECGGACELVTQLGVFMYRGVEVPVDESFLRCRTCGEELVTWEQARAKEELAAARYREMDRMLTPERIRSIRERVLGLTQSVFERVLALGEKTAARWESGRVIQNRATDHLFRLLERDPTALQFLAEEMGTVEELPAHFTSSTAWRPSVPHSIATRIQFAADQEGVHPDVYITMLLTERLTTQAVCVEVQKMHETLVAIQHEWKRSSLAPDGGEPWKFAYEQNQRERGYAAAA